jgi:glycosyltransferase involved in cell wall biosynthesis
MTTVHLVYPHGPRVSTPDAIGRNVRERLQERFRVVPYDWDEMRVIKPGPDDVLLGHPHPIPGTIFRRSARQPGWKRVIALAPYNHGDPLQVAFLDRVIECCDLYLAITGNHWYSAVERSNFSHWSPKMVHVDLAVDRTDFPPIKFRFNESGQRKFLYVGSVGWPKNTDYLAEIARMMPQAEISWMGSGKTGISGVTPLGFQDFQVEQARQLVAEHDFMITVSNADSNPTTILEAAAWGLIPVCTPQSGYAGYPGIQNIPLNEPVAAVDILRRLQFTPERRLREWQATNWQMLDTHFNWDRFTTQVEEAIESRASPTLGHAPWGRRARIRVAETQSMFVFRKYLKGLVGGLVRRRLKEVFR